MERTQNKRHKPARTMSNGRYAHVVGWGTDIPERILKNHEIEQMVDTSDKWIRERTGIAERRIADERDSTITMGTKAAMQALSRAKILPTEVELIIVATSSPTHLFPATACQIQDRLGASDAGAFDVLAACTGFIYGMGIAAAQIKAGLIETALVIGTETLSRIVDWTDRGTCILFGDGAGAFVLQASEVPGGVHDVVMHCDGSGGNLLYAPSGMRASWNGSEPNHVMTRMNGREVFRFATRIMASATEEVVERAGMKLDDIDLIIPHQANLRIIQAAARNLKLPMERFFVNIERYGNTSTASIPIAIAEAVEAGEVQPNNRLVLVGFGGGLTWGALVMDWGVEETPLTQIQEILREGWYILARMRSLVRQLLRFLGAILFGPTADELPRPRKREEIEESVDADADNSTE